MIDSYGRDINYMRISITDRCNLHCKYCMPEVMETLSHEEILRYEEILRICKIAVSLGITKFKITGGEPLVRKGCTDLIRALKTEANAEEVTITTNGLLLSTHFDALIAADIDGLTVSLSALNPKIYASISGHPAENLESLCGLLNKSVSAGIRTKINAVLLEENKEEVVMLTGLAEELPIDVRFIEQMPIGHGKDGAFISSDEVLQLLFSAYPDLKACAEKRGNGPARYFETEKLLGKIGIIDAISHKFCDSCNRIRLTSTGWLKPCLCYETGTDLRKLLRNGSTDEEIREAIVQQILEKPKEHCFEELSKVTEQRTMSQIGG